MSEYARILDKKEIPLLKRIMIRILSSIGKYGVKAFTLKTKYGELDFYYDYCKKHGYYVNYPYGHKEILYCPKCED